MTDSNLRRAWLRRCLKDEEIPRKAIMEHHLTDFFLFIPADENCDVHLVFAIRNKNPVEMVWVDD